MLICTNCKNPSGKFYFIRTEKHKVVCNNQEDELPDDKANDYLDDQSDAPQCLDCDAYADEQ